MAKLQKCDGPQIQVPYVSETGPPEHSNEPALGAFKDD